MTDSPASPASTASPAGPEHLLSRPAVLRLILCAGLFGGWLLYLALLVFTRSEVATGPRLLSRPQAWSSTFDVVARVDDPASKQVVIEQVLYPPTMAHRQGQKLVIPNLSAAGVFRGGQFVPDVTIPGNYLLLLHALEGDLAEVVPLPPSPGFSQSRINPRAYLATPDLLAQYGQIVKPTR